MRHLGDSEVAVGSGGSNGYPLLPLSFPILLIGFVLGMVVGVALSRPNIMS